MIELAKEMLRSTVDLLTLGGFFYEYGPLRSLLAIGGYSLVILTLARHVNIKDIYKINPTLSLLIGVASVCFVSLYFSGLHIKDYGYFYPPTILRRFESIEALSMLYGITMILYYNLYKLVLGESNRAIICLCVIATITSPLQLWVLISSSTRDFTRGGILTILFIVIVNVIKGKFELSNKNIFLCSALMVILMTFRQDILLYFPILMLAILIFYEKSVKEKITVIIKIIIYFLPGYLFLSSGVLNSLERASGRFIPGLSEDLVRTYYGEPSLYIGPFNDRNAFVVTKSLEYEYGESGIVSFLVGNINFFYEYLMRLPVVMRDTYMLPLVSSAYPPFFAESLFGNLVGYLRVVLSCDYLYGLALVFTIVKLRSRKRILAFIFISVAYLSAFNGLQFLHKNIFHLELVSYLVLFYGCASIINLFKNQLLDRLIGKR